MPSISIGEQYEGLRKSDTPEEEAKKTLRARENPEIQSTFVRRVLAGAYGINAVYFFRSVNYLNTITLELVDIICTCRPQLRRIAVMHLILQNGKQLPRPMAIRLFNAIEEYNNQKQRDDQRPKWGLHMTEAHVLAIADTPVPPELAQETTAANAKAKAKPAPKPTLKPSINSGRSTASPSATRPYEPAHGPRQPPTPPPGRGGGRDHGGKGGEGYSHH